MRIDEFDATADADRLLTFYRVFADASRHYDPQGPQIADFEQHLQRLAHPVRGLLPGGRTFGGWWSQSFGQHVQKVGLARQGDTVLGGYVIELPQVDNTDVAFCSVFASPLHERQGVGGALLRHCSAVIQEAGRKLIIGTVRDDSSGQQFVEALRATRAGTKDVRRILQVDDELMKSLPQLQAVAEEKCRGYSIVHWEGEVEDRYLDDLVALYNSMADAPRPEAMAADHWTPNRVRAGERQYSDRNLRTMHVAARDDKTDELAAYSIVVIDPLLPDWGFQNATVVTRAHRGRRLGLFTKVALHKWLMEEVPTVKHVMTTNDENNSYIIAVNEQFGFRVNDSFTTWEVTPGQVLLRS